MNEKEEMGHLQFEESLAKARPILFSGAMIQAILDRKKTQTRRVIKPQPPWENMIFLKNEGDYWMGCKPITPGEGEKAAETWENKCPYGKPGDILWVRETFCPVDDREFGGDLWYDYRATPQYGPNEPAGWPPDSDDPDKARWKPSIHMPKEACRILLRVETIRVERLWEITGKDALAEGIERRPGDARPFIFIFMDLWNEINDKRGFGWAANPWVWVVGFHVEALL